MKPHAPLAFCTIFCVQAIAAAIPCTASAQMSHEQTTKVQTPKVQIKPVRALPKDLAFSRIKKIGTKLIEFANDKFVSVSVGDIFLVLNQTNDGVTARIRCVKISATGLILADLEELGRGVTTRVLRNAIVIKGVDARPFTEVFAHGPLSLEDLVEAGSDERLFRRSLNPSGFLAVGAFGQRLSGVNYLLGTDLDTMTVSQWLHAEVYVPRVRFATWLNWFGLELDLLNRAKGNAQTRGAESGATQSIAYEASASTLSVAMRPTFSSKWVSRIGFLVGVWRRDEERVAVGQDVFGISGSRLTLRRQGFTYRLQAETQPATNLVFGIDALLPVKQQMTLEDESQGALVVAAGQWKRLEADVWMGLRVLLLPLPNRFQIEARAGALYRQESFTSSAFLGGESLERSSWPLYGRIGLAFVK